MTTAQLLTEARRLVAQGWCQGSFALDALDKPISYLSADARRFDLEGALMAACAGEDSDAYWNAAYAVRNQAFTHGFSNAQEFNDAPRRTLPEVLALIDVALNFADLEAIAA